MRKRLIFFAVLFILCLGGVFWIMSPRLPEPVYQGKPLSYWLRGYATAADDDDERPVAAVSSQAIEQIGTNAIPYLLRLLRQKDSRLQRLALPIIQRSGLVKVRASTDELRANRAEKAFEALGAKADGSVPELMAIYEQKISLPSRRAAAAVLGSLGPAASLAVPALVRGTTDPDSITRLVCVVALDQIHAEPKTVVPALVNLLNDPALQVQARTVQALGDFGADASPAVPALTQLMKTSFPGLSYSASNALDQIKSGQTDHK